MSSVNELITSLRAVDANSFASDDDRLIFVDELRGVLRRTQSPWDVAWDHAWVHGCTLAAIKTLIDASVFMRWVETGSKPMNTSELADLTGSDPLLLKRLLRQIAADHLITQIGIDTYAPTPWSIRVGTESTFASIYGKFYYNLVSPLFESVPFFLKEAGYKNPTSLTNSNFERVHGEGSKIFEYISSDETLNQHFADTMECISVGQRMSWVDLYDINNIIHAARPGNPLVVDVGGSKGHNLEKFLQKYPSVPKEGLILQDLPEVLEKVTVHPGITAYPYDFFTPQSVKGALVYYLSFILHDWLDEMATKILEVLRDAMERRYSKLLIHEVVVFDNEPSLTATTLDITMMATCSSLERSEKEWGRLIEGVEGLRIVKIWKARQAVESIIEVERVSLSE
ncbi:S-adenosyl-L-methionine-dependent methyltransferase [Xylaria sp. FL1042]|nr:S-adenosyl-L-methionine-dependent methyltransferase [Xylaria sp. FL1042]